MTDSHFRPGERVQTIREGKYGTIVRVLAGGHLYVVRFDDGTECNMGFLTLQSAVSPLRLPCNVVPFRGRFMCASRPLATIPANPQGAA